MSHPSGSSSASQEQCSSAMHRQAMEKYPEATETHLVSDYRWLPAKYTESLAQNAHITVRKSNLRICEACINLVRDIHDSAENKKRKASASPEKSVKTFEEVFEELENREFSTDEMTRLLEMFGRKIGTDFAEFVNSNREVSKASRRVAMTSTDSTAAWNSTYGPVRRFFEGILSIIVKEKRRDVSSEATLRRSRLLHRAMEGIYAALNYNYVSSFALAEMLYVYFLSNSRRACDIHGSASGCASFCSLQNMLSLIGTNTPKIPSDGYVIVAFDNNQVIGKTFRIQLESRVPANVVTTVTAFKIEVPNNPQIHEATFPMFANQSSEGKQQLVSKMDAFHSSSKDTVKQYLYKFIQTRLDKLADPAFFDSSDASYKDYVETDTVSPQERVGMDYNQVPEPVLLPCTVLDQPCITINPNSYKGVKKALDEILATALSDQRKWVTVVADGLPYSIAQEIIRHYVYCKLCKDGISDTEFGEHYIKVHGMAASTTPKKRMYSKILLRPGPGHYEMNFVRAIYSEWFQIFIEPVAEIMGFRSPKAKAYCASAADHHKSWQLLEITFESLTDELIYSYLRHINFSIPDVRSPSVVDFLETIDQTSNRFIKGVSQFVFEICFPVLLFRSGIRQCNFDVTIRAREVASVLFYAFRHPKYQKINCYDIAELIQVPASYRSAVHNESFRIPGSSTGQGIDFLLEQRNRKLKAFVLHNGVPTQEQWLHASRSLPLLEEIVAGVSERTGVPISTMDGHRPHNFVEEKRAARKLFRNTGSFDMSAVKEFTNRNEVKVSDEFSRCRQIGEENQKKYYHDFISTGKARVSNLIEPVQILKPTSQWTKPKLVQEIKTAVVALPEDLRGEFMKGLSGLNKDLLVRRYESLIASITDLEVSMEEN